MSNQLNLYGEPIKDGYSYQTSLHAYKESGKEAQRIIILNLIKKGFVTLLQLSEITGFPQSTVSGRVNDLIDEGKVYYNSTVEYKNRKRKMIFIKP